MSPRPSIYSYSAEEVFERIIAGDSLNCWFAGMLRDDLMESGDITTQSFVGAEAIVSASIGCRKSGVASGFRLLEHLEHPLLEELGGNWNVRVRDGEEISQGQSLADITADTQPLLALERTLLNFLGHLSGIATSTRQFVDAVSGTGARICDTRKTSPAPGLRLLEKYAVGCGGGAIHRLGLYDAVLIKDNHLAAMMTQANWQQRFIGNLEAVKKRHRPRFIEIEVDTLEQLEQMLSLPGEPGGLMDIILLDNMGPAELRQAVELRNCSVHSILLESSGGVSLEMVRDIAETGVDRIAVGAITHSAPWLDIGLDIEL